MNEERTGLWLRQTQHISANLWHRYSVSVNQVTVMTVQLSWWLLLLLIIGSVTTSGNKSCIDLKDTIVANSTDNPTHTPTTFTKEEPLDNHVSVQSLCFLDIQPKMKNWIVHHSTRFQNDTSVLTACWVCRMLHKTCIHIINIYFNSGQNPSFWDTVALATQWVVCIRCEIWGILKIG